MIITGPFYRIIPICPHLSSGPAMRLCPLIHLALPFFAFWSPGVVVEWIQNGWIPGAQKWGRPLERGGWKSRRIVCKLDPFFYRYPPVAPKRCCPLTSKRPTRFSIGSNRRSNCDDPPGGPNSRPPLGISTCDRTNGQPSPHRPHAGPPGTNFVLRMKNLLHNSRNFSQLTFDFSVWFFVAIVISGFFLLFLGFDC